MTRGGHRCCAGFSSIRRASRFAPPSGASRGRPSFAPSSARGGLRVPAGSTDTRSGVDSHPERAPHDTRETPLSLRRVRDEARRSSRRHRWRQRDLSRVLRDTGPTLAGRNAHRTPPYGFVTMLDRRCCGRRRPTHIAVASGSARRQFSAQDALSGVQGGSGCKQPEDLDGRRSR